MIEHDRTAMTKGKACAFAGGSRCPGRTMDEATRRKPGCPKWTNGKPLTVHPDGAVPHTVIYRGCLALIDYDVLRGIAATNEGASITMQKARDHLIASTFAVGEFVGIPKTVMIERMKAVDSLSESGTSFVAELVKALENAGETAKRLEVSVPDPTEGKMDDAEPPGRPA